MQATKAAPLLVLRARTAAEMMRPSPISIRGDATVAEALKLFTDKGISAAPVIDDAGRPVGVLSHSDLMVHERSLAGRTPDRGDQTIVYDLMTPTVFSVSPQTTAAEVVAMLLQLKVHHLFVVDAAGTLIGVISAVDVLRRLRP
jgi:CBS domain-containing protein